MAVQRQFTVGGYTLGQIRKTVEAAIGIALIIAAQLIALTTEILPDGWITALIAVVGVLTAVRVFLADNAKVLDRFAPIERETGTLG